MNIKDLREAQVRFNKQKDSVLKPRKELYKIEANFTRFFSPSKIKDMRIDEYTIGKGHENNFCYTLERKLDGLGRIIGANAFKFGVYYGKTNTDENHQYRFSKKFGDTYKKAFLKVKESILDLLDAGEKEDLDSIAKNLLSPMFKGKILSTYFPEIYLSVFSPDHLDHFLRKLDLDTPELTKGSAVYKRTALTDFKNKDIIMKEWSLDLFSHFLYSEYPGGPTKESDEAALADYTDPEFPKNPKAEFINLETSPPKDSPENKNNGKYHGKKTDYEAENRKMKKLGDRGEKIVLDLEKERLTKIGRKDLAAKVKRVSLESDSYGYDILSFNDNGTKRYIEVKATRAKVGKAKFFISVNELNTAEEKAKNYYIYLVYDVTSTSPKVWAINSLFTKGNKDIVMTPTNYRVVVNTTKLKKK